MFFPGFKQTENRKLFVTIAIMFFGISLIVQPLSFQSLYAQNVSSTNLTSSPPIDLAAKMKQLESSNNLVDIATLAYIWGYPLIIQKRTADFTTSPNTPPGPTRGPVNKFAHATQLINASFTDVVRPNQDTLYSTAFLDLKNGPIVLKVPPIRDRYYVLQFMDGYTNNFMYVGTRTNITSGNTYLITGPGWTGTIPADMTQIKSPTNLAGILGRILVNGPSDLSNVTQLQKYLTLTPLSVSDGNVTSENVLLNQSSEIPISPQPAFMPKTGIKIFDELGHDIIDNPPFAGDQSVVSKLKSIGIGPGMMPSKSDNQSILKGLDQGIIEGEKLIDEKIANIGSVVNGWSYNLDTGNYGTDYLLRAAVAKTALGANSPEEALYPLTFVDSTGLNLTGSNKYVLHFDKDKIPPVNGFWSITMYNSKYLFVDNPLNRYSIGDRTVGLKYNADGSLDIYIQHDSPGKEKESNWLPAPTDNFSLLLRLYIPQKTILEEKYDYPPVQIENKVGDSTENNLSNPLPDKKSG